MMFKMMKVFDCQKMPTDIKKAFFKCSEDLSNDCAAIWDVELCDGMIDGYNDVSKWLVENGAEEDERVIVKRWW